MSFEICERALLTGAGFTYNFGGLLAGRMQGEIYNKIDFDRHPALHGLLIQEPELDYESLYIRVMSGGYTQEDQAALQKAVFDAYMELDEAVCDYFRARRYASDSNYPDMLNFYRSFLQWFGGAEGEVVRGYFFTLNQDLFMERWDDAWRRFWMPGMPCAQVRFSAPPYGEYQPWPVDQRLYVPTAEELDAIKRADARRVSVSGRLHYVKLHGSLNWWSKRDKKTDKAIMVIGGKKDDQIADEPLLAWYWDLFERALCGQNRRLWIIGYSFRDEHINRVIAQAIRDCHLRWFSISPSPQSRFIEGVRDQPYGDVLLEGHRQHFEGGLAAIYPTGGGDTRLARKIAEALKQ